MSFHLQPETILSASLLRSPHGELPELDRQKSRHANQFGNGNLTPVLRRVSQHAHLSSEIGLGTVTVNRQNESVLAMTGCVKNIVAN